MNSAISYKPTGDMRPLYSVQRQRVMHGEGFFDDLWSGIKSAGNYLGEKVLPKVIDVGLPILAKSMGAGKRRKVKQSGGKKKNGKKKVMRGGLVAPRDQYGNIYKVPGVAF